MTGEPSDADAGRAAFWDVAQPLIADGSLEEGTIMGGRCVRNVAGEFVAMPHHKGPGLVVKLPRDRVDELIASGSGQSFAPAGKVFRAWVAVPPVSRALSLSMARGLRATCPARTC